MVIQFCIDGTDADGSYVEIMDTHTHDFPVVPRGGEWVRDVFDVQVIVLRVEYERQHGQVWGATVYTTAATAEAQS